MPSRRASSATQSEIAINRVVANFGSAILDLPMASSADDADRAFVTNTEKIPPLGTEVFVILGPRPAKANEKRP